MKKFRVLALVMIFVLCFSTVALAAPSKGIPKEPKEATINFGGNMTLVVGQTVTLTATSLKQGSTYLDSWLGATKLETKLETKEDGKDYYVSTATFTANETGIYTVDYFMIMYAGNSSVTFEGKATMTITVVNPNQGTREVIGFDITEVLYTFVTPGKSKTQQLKLTNIIAIYSNGERVTFDYTVGGFKSQDEVNRKFDIEFDGYSQQYTFGQFNK